MIVFVYVGVVTFMYFGQESLLYHPKTELASPQEYGINMQVLSLTANDGSTQTAWYSPPVTPDAYTVVFFHGNAGNLGSRVHKFTAFQKAGWGVMAISYSGYGNSEGSPNEAAIYDDARAALAYIKGKNIRDNQLILYGESLGTGIASRMATEIDPALIVLESPYTSIADRGQELYPWLPVKWLLKDNFSPSRELPQVRTPVLIFHGEKDTIVPVEHGKSVYETAHEPKRLILLPEYGHNDIPIDTIIAEIRHYLDELTNNQPTG